MKLRERICAGLFELSKKPYAFIFKRKVKAWGLKSTDLQQFDDNTLGYAVSQFLITNKIELIDKLESHDVYHVITGTGTTVKEEVGMQFLLMGNGKRSVYLYSTVVICSLLLPEYLKYFNSRFQFGKKLHPIHKLNLLQELQNPLEEIQKRIKRHKIEKLELWASHIL
ncbi:hypothetical protein K6119_17100 [Paracrocinitomix mangrovi]|uniref:hypothetical protein n=1 Tax=Paracrocinitomix mangrovi TaxID=2862509 RepID=UPI001C8DBCA8|nr:hypothetical protein [Paracrocinitomix mangrovi]UKN01445.1 hypothetical protein K6119_17100 [Paracrocinitomix mangrovi]